eukprot:CAMPEP_0176359970 /NCGR_PEP_ID=MMETSP0126-20121128/16796_1 /TAXON_ID=141414 ORGANISM="Strombidinopsis acuminatum, Strain SPMC142" /NCGR_SAMPLE_ID=MMETSP0126 /ASSEMBLY_ACC=CAM_ASM_000229 /LENGTH=67 /DNA_ID=CAMNT_0017715091 /DNA_START=30 /DNA_END=233 /DNA_ORIENTATION=+
MEAAKTKFDEHAKKEMEFYMTWPEDLRTKVEATMATEEFIAGKAAMNEKFFQEADKNADGQLDFAEW